MIDKNKQYTTRSGLPVEIYATDRGGDYSVHGAILIDGVWIGCSWTSDGTLILGHKNDRDIIMNAQPYAEDLGVDPSEGGDVGVQPLVHTPRPWRVYCDEARGMPRCLIVDKDDGEIASVNPHRSAWNENAELIAAAPELLHACELLLMLSLPQDISGMAMVEVARRTVRKAKGLD